MSKPCILIFSVFYFPFVGGAEVALKEVITRLKDKYAFTIITGKHSRHTKRRETIDGIHIIRVGTGIQAIDKLFFPLFAAFNALRMKTPDLLFCLLENQAALAGNLYLAFRNVPAILNMQSGDTEEFYRKKLGLFSFLYNWVYNKKYHYVVLSKYLKQRAKKHGIPDKQITIVPNGVNTSHFDSEKISKKKKQALIKKHNLQDKRVIFTASRLALKNAIDDVINAMPRVLEDVPNAVFVIAGTGELEQEHKQLAKNLNIEKNVRFVGFVTHDKLPAYLSISDAFIRPSISEGFGNSFVEALACGVPIIGTNVGGIPDFLEHEKTGLFAKARDPQDIAKQLIRLLTDNKLADTIVRNGQHLVRERYDWNTIAQQHNNVIKKLLQSE